jgi:hypothetical protein
MVRGDQYYMAVCNKTGTIAVYNAGQNLFLSPAADGPLVFNKTLDGNQVLNVYSKYGRSFSLLRIPYALKLLMQELQVMGIQMRIITEDNIDQLLNLSYQSRNIDKLLHIDELSNADIKTIIDNYKKDMDAKIKQIEGQVYNQKNANALINNQLKEEPRSLNKDSIESIEDALPGKPNVDDLDVILPDYIMSQSQELQLIYKLLKPEYMTKFKNYNQDYQMQILNKLNEQSKNATPEKIKELLNFYLIKMPSEHMQEQSPDYPSDVSPAYNPNELEEYTSDDSLQYNPTQQGTQQSPNQKGGYANIFEDPVKNDAFNQLPSDKQSIILQMTEDERENIMNQIVRQTNLQETLRSGINEHPTNSTNSTNILADYFNRLPPSNQIVALKGGYNAVTKDIGKIGGEIPRPVVTIHKPVDPTTQLYKQFPHLKPESGENDVISDSNETDIEKKDTHNDNSTSENISSGPISVKKISF